MLKVYLYTFISVTIVSIVSLIGVIALSLKKNTLNKITLFFVSFAAGGLFGDAFIHLLPEAFKAEGSSLLVSLYVVMGILIFFILEKFLRWRHCHIPDCNKHIHPVAAMNLIGDAIHNLIDGMLIGASFSVSVPIGITSTLAIILHEIPQELGEFGVLIHGSLSVRKALVFNLLSAMTAFLGAGISLFIGGRIFGYSQALLPITAGGFLYIAGSDLIPELHHELELRKSIWQLLFMILGVATMALLVFLE